MEVDEALYTTRAMRRLLTDPIPLEEQRKILDAAVRAPTGGNAQTWRFVLVDDPDLRRELGRLYRECMNDLWETVYADRLRAARAEPELAESKEMMRMYLSADHLGEHFGDAPLILFGFAGMGDRTGGSIFPALWSAMLAARALGIGSTLTQVLGFFRAEETNELLGVPDGEGWTCSAAVPMGYPTGRWGVARRRPVHEVSARNSWTGDVGFRVDEPLWSPGP